MAVRVADLDDRDRFNRLALRAALRGDREAAGVSQRTLAARLGTDQPGVGRYERTDQWRITTVLRWARALDRRVVLRPVGFPAATRPMYWGKNTDIEGALHAILRSVTGAGEASDEWTVAKLQSELAGIRAACGISQLRLADRIGVSEQALSQFERGGNGTRVVVAQRYARGVALCARLPLAHLSLTLEQPAPEDTDAAIPTA
jgi:transcriptional regulator with XRE-family HTH domain